MSTKVLIISEEEDLHSVAVARQINNMGRECIILDNRDFPTKCSITCRCEESSYNLLLEHSKYGEIDFSSISGLWWRRPQQYKLSEEIPHPALRQFAIAECSQAFKGSLVSSAPIFINNIANSRHASMKLLQLKKAIEFGLSIPKTLVTTKQEEARSFISECKEGCIYKTFTGCDFGFYETRLISSQEDLEELWRLTYCPVILQEQIVGEYDIRVTIVSNEIFAGKIMYKQGRHPVDGRIDRVPVEPINLPNDIQKKLLSLISSLGLIYATIDFRYSKERGYTFFEINPEGQYLWIEIETGLPISKAIATALLKNTL